MKKQNATDAYVAVIAEISAKLDAIKAQAVDNHLGVSPDAVNWGNVGTAQHLLVGLAEAAEIAGANQLFHRSRMSSPPSLPFRQINLASGQPQQHRLQFVL